MTNRPLFYLLDGQGNPYPSDDSHAANELLKDADARRVQLTEKTVAGRHIMISTIFLCMDEQYALTLSETIPVELFQTCVFVNKITTGFERYYKTRDHARQGHEEVCQNVDFLGEGIEKGYIQWSELGKKLSQMEGLTEIAQIAQETGKYD